MSAFDPPTIDREEEAKLAYIAEAQRKCQLVHRDCRWCVVDDKTGRGFCYKDDIF